MKSLSIITISLIVVPGTGCCAEGREAEDVVDWLTPQSFRSTAEVSDPRDVLEPTVEAGGEIDGRTWSTRI